MAEDPKRKGRPPLTEGKRTFKIDVRFTEEEYKLITEMEQALGLSKTQLVRSKLLHNGTGTVINAKELIGTLIALGNELGRSGNNINQLAHYANTLKLKEILSPVVAERLELMMHDHLRSRTDLNVTLRKLIRMLGH
jgi:Bacterial mobilisation protein (MobC)